jgi:hypothetical protein
MTLLDSNMPARHWAFIFVTLGIGHGLVLTALNFAVQALAKDNQDASAAGFYTFMRSLGMCIGVTAAGTFFRNRLASHLRNLYIPESVSKEAAEFALELRRSDWPAAVKNQYITAFTRSFKDLWVSFLWQLLRFV